ncbi:MAG: hypothetical protein WC503_00745 [Candidatus Shapirobacteria bacterium]
MPIEKSDKDFYTLTNHYLSNTSELNLFNILYDTESKEYFLNLFRNYIINEKANKNVLYFLNHDIDDTDFPDTISMKYYNSPYLWWVICLFNDILNPFEDLLPGNTLKILKPNFLYQLLAEINAIANK